jgi:SHS2 domain-containing protein
MHGFRDSEVISYYTGNVDDPHFEELEHTADWAVRVVGPTLGELFANAALAMIDLVGAKPSGAPASSLEINLEALDLETLLVSWLEELLFGMEMRNVTYADMHLSVEREGKLSARMSEIPASFTRSHIKAVTYNDLRITESKEGFEVVIVFDV